MNKIFIKILEIIFPNRCLACHKMIGAEGLFCYDDWQKLQFITAPKCEICSQPFMLEIDGPQCAKCLTAKPSYDASIVIFRYNDSLKKIIGDMKYRDATNLSKKFGKMLWQKIAPEMQNYNLIIAVPLHKQRLRERKFNQSILLAKAILQNFNEGKNYSKFLHIIKNIFAEKNIFRSPFKKNISEFRAAKNTPKFYPNILLRTKYTTAQVKLNRKMREENLRGVFKINEKYRDKIKGSSVLLVDDVVTTGATLENCALALKEAGATKITIATIARTTLDK